MLFELCWEQNLPKAPLFMFKEPFSFPAVCRAARAPLAVASGVEQFFFILGLSFHCQSPLPPPSLSVLKEAPKAPPAAAPCAPVPCSGPRLPLLSDGVTSV